MNTRNNIKLSFGAPKYSIYGAQVKCFMSFEIKMPYLLEQITTLLVDKKIIPAPPKSVRGIATVSTVDIENYDEQKGMKIAMAKAEIVAYTKAENWLHNVANILFDKGHAPIDDFLWESDAVIRHDEGFIDKF